MMVKSATKTPISMIALIMTSILLLSLSISTAFSFSVGRSTKRSFFGDNNSRSSSSQSSSLSSSSSSSSSLPKSAWDDLSARLPTKDDIDEPVPQLTLYRDTNGWCPFCERIWVILRVKNIPYQERLINLQNKPDWYKDLVPTSLVPAVLFHEEDVEDKSEDNEDDKEETKSKPLRTLIWESSDIMTALDERFPNTPRMVLNDDPKYTAAVSMNDDLVKAGFMYAFAARNASLTEDDIQCRKSEFEFELDRLDYVLGDVNKGKSGDDGASCFRLGDTFTGVDAMMIPTLERWKYQLPVTNGLDIMKGRNNIQSWFDTMDNYKPYADRVSGDEYSWTAVSSTFLRMFSSSKDGEVDPKTKVMMELADQATEDLVASFVDGAENLVATSSSSSLDIFANEAAAKLISNHEAVVADCTRSDPKSQKDLPRSTDESSADLALHFASSVLLSDGENVMDVARNHPLPSSSSSWDAAEAGRAARTVASRVCVPRDMGRPAAVLLRGVLVEAAKRFDAMAEEMPKAKVVAKEEAEVDTGY